MARRGISTAVASLVVAFGCLGAAAAAGAATTTQLVMSQGAAANVLGYGCGGITERVYATGFATNGYPAGAAHLRTVCSGGHGTHFTVEGWGSVTWTWYGVTWKYAKLTSAPVVSPTFSETDKYGDRVYNTATAAYLETTSPPIQAPAPPTGVSANVYRTGPEGESGPQDATVGWTPAPETAVLITSSTITATPVGSTAPVLTKTIIGSGISAVIGTLELNGSLVPETTYNITVTSTDEEGTSNASAPYQVKTLSPVAAGPPPAVVTEEASAVTHTSATLNGDVDSAGEEVSFCQFEYGTTESHGTVVPCASLPAPSEKPVPVSASLAGLTPNTTYHYWLVASTSAGTTHGLDRTFSTVSAGPLVFTEAATEVMQTSAMLNAVVNPAGEEVTTCEFEYGTTEAYGSFAACASPPGAGTAYVPVSAALLGLAPNTTYHFRIVAVNAAGSKDGEDQVFTTPAALESHPAPVIKKVSPKSGPSAGNTTVTITGSGFNGATVVMFGSNEGAIVSINSDTSMKVRSPKGTKGTVNVRVTGPGGTSATTRKDHFRYKK
jgi:hypothetical protein